MKKIMGMDFENEKKNKEKMADLCPDAFNAFTVPSLRQIASASFATAVSDLDNDQDCRNLVESLESFPPTYLKRVIPEMPWQGMKTLWQSGKFDEYLTSEAMNQSVQREENRLRQLYAKNPTHRSVRLLTAGLVSIFSDNPFGGTNIEMFKLRDWGNDFFVSAHQRQDDKHNKDNEESKASSKSSVLPAEEKDQGEQDQKAPPKKMILFAEGNIPSRIATGSASTVRSLSDFRKNFNAFTSNALLELDWSNVLAAGGACTACLLPVDEQTHRAAWFDPEYPWEEKRFEANCAEKNKKGSRVKKLYSEKDLLKFEKRSKSHKSRDIDLFLYGLNMEEAVEKIKQIHEAITETSRRPPLVVINGHAVTFYREFPHRSIQVVSRLYKSPSEVLLGFDVDSCCVGFDGEKVFVAPRTIRAFNTRCNVVDMSRRSLTYESRLFKYAKRNFAVVVPNIERSEVNPGLFDMLSKGIAHGNSYEIKGLHKLLMHELSFRDFREPSCHCVSMYIGRALASEGDDLLKIYKWADKVHTQSCFRAKCAAACQPQAPPVSIRQTHIHNRLRGFGSLGPNAYAAVGPTEEDATRLLRLEMRSSSAAEAEAKAPASSNNECDYEYITLPWKKNVSMEMCYNALQGFLNQHECNVDWKLEAEEEGWSPEFLEDVNPNAPILFFDFDVSKNLQQIKWVQHDAGRQLLTGSFHPLDDETWYDNVELKPGVHKYCQIVLESIDYPVENEPNDEAKVHSSMVIRSAICEIFPNYDLETSLLRNDYNWNWFIKNNRRYDRNVPGNWRTLPPWWWQPRIVLVAAATPLQVESFKVSLACATPAPFEKLSFNEYTIVVGDDDGKNRQVTLAQAMSQPALNRCGHCSIELLVPNRCRGCRLVSFCNKKCQQLGWKKHRKMCASAKKTKK